MKSLIIISSVIALFFQVPKQVYICKKDNISSILYDEKKGVNIYIDNKLVKDKKLQQGIKLYIASFFVSNKEKLVEDFTILYKQSPAAFGRQHKEAISNVIYYLEHIDHGNLPLVYGREAYVLLDITELEPVITSVKTKLNSSGMYLIDIEYGDEAKDIDSVKSKQ